MQRRPKSPKREQTGRMQRLSQVVFAARLREFHANRRKLANMDKRIAVLKATARDRWTHLRQHMLPTGPLSWANLRSIQESAPEIRYSQRQDDRSRDAERTTTDADSEWTTNEQAIKLKLLNERSETQPLDLGSEWSAPLSEQATPDSLPTLERVPTDANIDLNTDDLNWIQDYDETHDKKQARTSLGSTVSSGAAAELTNFMQNLSATETLV